MPVRLSETDAASTVSVPRPQPSRTRWRRALLVVILCLAGLLLMTAVILAAKWPFTRAALTQSLEQETQAQVQIGGLREIYFPHPGCIAQNVTMQRDAASPKLTVRRLTIAGSYFGLLHHYIPK